MDQPEKPKGRGRGRGKPGASPKPPNPEAVAKVEASAEPPVKDQFADASNSQPTPTQAPAQNSDSKTSVGKGAVPPLVKDLKDALKEGPQVDSSSRLNPQPPELVPSLTVKGLPMPVMNGPSSGNSLDTRPVMSKMQPFSTSRLNAGAAEFVPSGSLQPSQDNSAEPSGDQDPPVEKPSFGPQEIIKGFEPVGSVPNLESVPIVKAAAEMLVKGTLYVGSFDRLKIKLLNTLNSFSVSEEVLTNLAEMLIHWGVFEPYFCYTSCKICEIISDAEHGFRNALVRRMQQWYKKESKTLNTSKTIGIINYSLFFAELFTRLRVGNEPIEILASNIFNLVGMLLDLKTNNTVIGACNILKLTGVFLEQCEKSQKSNKMEKVINLLKKLATEEDSSFSRTCVELITLVIEMHARKWIQKEVFPKSLSLTPPVKEAKGKLNVDAAPFVPTSFQIEQPVINAAEWNEYETDSTKFEDTVEGVEYDYPDGDDGLDPEIELEMEAFIDAIEEHLLMQDFDPELREQK